ncbi:hypothetical protein [Glutamicibacter creatinolyticus]|uniref:hypothetical protein n=1 Tax=Glutamicibacter creatinolyticus TaxID=162496 RepID=UPI0031D7B75F
MITEQQAITLANLLAMLRPNDWRPNQLMDLFHQHRQSQHHFRDITEAAVKAANNPDIKSPAVIFMDGKHWNNDRNTSRPKNQPCQEHAGQDAHTCVCCWADIKLGERPETMLGKRMSAGTPNAEGAAAVREALKTTRGVAPF